MEGERLLLEIKIKRNLPDFSLDINFSVHREILSILGPSGSGKTMTLLCIAGLLQPDEGSIILNGRTLFSSAERIFLPPQERKIGFVFQNYALFPHLTVAENIAYGIHDLPKKETRTRVDELLALINIQGLKERYPGELSSGQQQRAALARAIAPEPEALLLDEPFSALDTYRRERLEYELISLNKYYRGDILFVTHDLAQGFKLGKRMAIYDRGSIVQCDSKHNVIAGPVNRTAARLTGVKNIFSGSLSAIEAGSINVYIEEFKTTLKVITPALRNLRLNQPCTIGIRPEHIEIREQQDINTIPCRVNRQVEGVTNSHHYYHADSDIKKRYTLEKIISKTPVSKSLKAGESCLLYLPPERLITLTDQEVF